MSMQMRKRLKKLRFRLGTGRRKIDVKYIQQVTHQILMETKAGSSRRWQEAYFF